MTLSTTLPWMGGELGSLEPDDSGCYEITGTLGGVVVYDSAFARCALYVVGLSGAKTPTWTAAPFFTWHARHFLNGGSAPEKTCAEWLNGATVVMRLTGQNGGLGGTLTYRIYTLQSSVLTLAGSFDVTGQIVNTIDIALTAGASGAVSAYVAGTQRLSVTGLNHSDFAGVTQAHPLGWHQLLDAAWSEMIADTSLHVGDRLLTFNLDTDSATNTGWTGDVSDIDEIVTNDASNISAGSANLISTFYDNGLSISLNVVALGLGVRIKCDPGGGPQNAQGCIRVASTNYFTSTSGLTSGYQAMCASWPINPATSLPWAAVAAASVEGGAKSIT